MNEIRVERGAPTEEELAAAIAVVTAALAEAEKNAAADGNSPTSNWSRNSGLLRAPLAAGPGQWQASYRNGLR